jgi:hypothetical protein
MTEKKRSNGVLVYSILFILIGLFVCLPIIQNFIMSNMSEEQIKLYYMRQMRVSTTNTNMPEKLRPEYMAQQSYQLQKDTKTQIPQASLYITLCIYLGIIITGIGLLRLKSWACKSIPALSMLGVAQIIFSNYIFFSRVAPIMKKYFEDMPFGQAILPFTMGITAFFAIGYVIFFLSSIYYFTRPKVKEQFI